MNDEQEANAEANEGEYKTEYEQDGERSLMSDALPILGVGAAALLIAVGGIWWLNRDNPGDASSLDEALAGPTASEVGAGNLISSLGGESSESTFRLTTTTFPEDLKKIAAFADGENIETDWTFSDWEGDLDEDSGGASGGAATTTTTKSADSTQTTKTTAKSTAGSTTTPTTAGRATTSVAEGTTRVWGRVVDETGAGVAFAPVEFHADTDRDGFVDEWIAETETSENGWYGFTPDERGCYGVVFDDFDEYQIQGDENRLACLEIGHSVHVADGVVKSS